MPGINKEHRNQYALVTGATSGIGYELAKLFANDGYHLLLVARTDDRLQEVTNEFKQLGVEVTPLAYDLFEASAADAIYHEVKRMGINVHVLVNNAGQGEHGRFHEVEVERHHQLIQLNITSLVTLTHHFLSDMLRRNEGRILNLSSVVAKTPAPEFAVYAASKAFVLSLSEALSKEVEGTNVTVTALMPGRTDTDFFSKAHMEHTKEYQEHKLDDPADVARAGYDAMMRGDTKVVAGVANKMMVGIMNVMPDSANAATMQKNMQPAEEQKRAGPGHEPSKKAHKQ